MWFIFIRLRATKAQQQITEYDQINDFLQGYIWVQVRN